MLISIAQLGITFLPPILDQFSLDRKLIAIRRQGRVWHRHPIALHNEVQELGVPGWQQKLPDYQRL
jgi:hypothetical protein